MIFESERIENADINYFNSFGFKDVLGNPARAYWWAINREESIFLFPRGGGSFDVPISFGLCLEGKLVKIEVTKTTEGNIYDENLKIHWFINRIIVPITLFELGYSEKKVVEIVIEAFLGLGTTGVDNTDILEVTVKNEATIIVN